MLSCFFSSLPLLQVGFANTLSKEGAAHNILVNTIAPVAGSRMTETMMPKEIVDSLKPEYVSPLVVCLCHEKSTANGEIFECGAGYFAPVRIQRGPGVSFSLASPPTVEEVSKKWSEITSFPQDTSGNRYPTSAKDSFSSILSNLGNTTTTSSGAKSGSPPPPAVPKNGKTANSSESDEKSSKNTNGSASSSTAGAVEPTKYNRGKDLPGEFKSAMILDILREFLDADVVNKTKAIFVFDITNPEKKNRKWTLNLKDGKGSIHEGLVEGVKPDATLALSDEDFVKLVYQDAQPQKLFMTGKLKVKGNLALAMKFENILRSMEHKAKGKL